MLIATAFHDPQFIIINRQSKDPVRKMAKEKAEENDGDGEDMATMVCTTDVIPLPGYDFQAFPYCMTRQKHCISLLDTRHEKIYPLIPDKKPEFDNEFMSVV